MKKKSLGVAIVIFVILVIVLFLLFGAVGTGGPESAVRAEEYILLEDSMDAVTDADKEAKYIDYLEQLLEGEIADSYPAVKSADITLSGIEENMQADIRLELQDEFAADSAAEVAGFVAAAAGSATTDEIVIRDVDGNVLFGGSGK